MYLTRSEEHHSKQNSSNNQFSLVFNMAILTKADIYSKSQSISYLSPTLIINQFFIQNRVEELDEELELERGARAKAEKSRQVLNRELEDISAKLEESGNATATQIELNRKREAELTRLKEELESHALQHESTLATLRQKHNGVISDLGDQIDTLNKAKAK